MDMKSGSSAACLGRRADRERVLQLGHGETKAFRSG